MLAALAELPPAPAVGGELAVLEPAAAGLPGPRLEAPQPEPLLELPARFLGAWPVVVDAGLAAVLGHQGDDEVGVVGAAGGAAVADRHPPALRLGGLAGEPHLLDELLADLRPPLVRELGLLRMQRQGAVPHVRVPGADQAAVLVALGDRHPGAERLPRLIEEPRQRHRIAAFEQLRLRRSGPPPASRRPGAGPGAPRACPSRPGRAARRASCRRG